MQQTMQKILPTAPPPPPPPPAHRHRITFPTMSSANAQSSTDDDREICADNERGASKRILKETVDAVVNSFAKHTREFGRGEIEKPI